MHDVVNLAVHEFCSAVYKKAQIICVVRLVKMFYKSCIQNISVYKVSASAISYLLQPDLRHVLHTFHSGSGWMGCHRAFTCWLNDTICLLSVSARVLM